MKLGKNRIHLLIMLFAVSSLLVHVPSDAFAADAIKSSKEINSSTDNGPTLEDGGPVSNPGDQFGNSVADMGDLNGDGVTDLVVGAWTDDDGCGANCGAIHILYMDTDGSLAASTDEFDCSHAKIKCGNWDGFGKSVAPIDLNNDGVNDIAVGAHKDNCSADSGCGGWDDRGVIHILFMDSDENVTSVEEIDGRVSNAPSLGNNSFLGWSLANIGDYDGDGVDDLVAGSYTEGPGSNQGAIFIMFMNTDGSLDKTIEINSGTTNGPDLSNNNQFGWSVANIGDLNGDGVTDLAVGARGDDTVHILFMNSCNQCDANAAVSSVVEINSTTLGVTVGGTFGDSVASMGDLDGDNVQDLVIGSRTDAGGGSVRIVYMNTDGSPKSSVLIDSTSSNGPTISSNDWFGNAVANIGDLDGDGITDMAVGAEQDDHGGTNRGALHIIFLLETASTSTTGEEKESSSDTCYDCEAPKLTKVEVHITSPNSDTHTSSDIWNFEQDTPYPMFDDYKTPIIADPGDEVQLILELTDNRTLERIEDSGTYTNFLTKPNDMNTFYANNFDEYGKVSTTFYEWHQTGEDLFYDYDNTVQWSPADVVIEESGEMDNRVCCNQDDLTGTFTISFKMKFLQPMQTTDVWVQGTDRSGNFFKVSLPLTLKIAGNEPLVFESKVNQKVLGFYDESMLNDVVSDWTGSSQDVSELAEILGIADEQLPPWVANLALWVSEDKISMGDMIVSIEHLINN